MLRARAQKAALEVGLVQWRSAWILGVGAVGAKMASARRAVENVGARRDLQRGAARFGSGQAHERDSGAATRHHLFAGSGAHLSARTRRGKQCRPRHRPLFSGLESGNCGRCLHLDALSDCVEKRASAATGTANARCDHPHAARPASRFEHAHFDGIFRPSALRRSARPTDGNRAQRATCGSGAARSNRAARPRTRRRQEDTARLVRRFQHAAARPVLSPLGWAFKRRIRAGR